MQDIIDTIREDIRRRSQNKGVAAFKRFNPTDGDLTSIISDCVYYIQFQFHKITADYGTGFGPLTGILMGSGEEVRRAFDIEPNDSPEFQDTVASMGAVIVHALGRCNYISVQRGEKQRSQFDVQAQSKWMELGETMQSRVSESMRHIVFKNPEDMTNYKHADNNMRVVKRSTPEHFESIKDSEHMQALNKLQQTAWRVNKETLTAVLDHKWDTEVPEIPKVGSKKLVDILYHRLEKDPSVQEDYNKASAEWETKRKALKERSNKMERLMTVTKALNLMEREVIHNLMQFDYRGRMYYCEPYFHYQGNDIMKGILEFSEGKAVTERGLYWLKLQAAATYNKNFTREELKELKWTEIDYDSVLDEQQLDDLSLDKMSLRDREQWVDHSMGLIRDTAQRKQLNEKAEYPTLFLATCIEIDKTLKALADGTVHVSHLPVSIDGSQNVLQHTSAINRDAETALKVGVRSTPVPSDIYVAVGKRMAAEIPEFFDGRGMTMKDIRKSISKRATMVRNYSAGRKSIASNMYRDCVKNEATDKFGITPSDCFMLAGVALKAIDGEVPSNSVFRKYLQKLVIHEIGKYDITYADETEASKDWEKMFASYNTLNAKARTQFDSITRTRSSGLGKDEVSWTTPTGFVVIQNICYTATNRITPSILGKRLNLQLRYESKIPNLEKHKSAIAANFIHSQDASHAARVINAFSGKSFGLVHDSFAVHASDVDELLQITKDTFKAMYDIEENYYELIRDQILTDDADFTVKTPKIGDLTFDELDDSDYFFA